MALCIGASSPAAAEVTPLDQKVTEGSHKPGELLLRLALGVHYGGLSQSHAILGTTEVSGAGVGASIAVGLNVARNLSVNLDIFAAGLVSPRWEEGGQVIPDRNGSATGLAGFGLGVTYYLPFNIYAALAVGPGVLNVSDDDSDLGRAQSKTGVALNFMLGKEFWVSRDWGVGFAGQLVYGNVPTSGNNVSIWSVGLAFSATYN